MEAGRIFFWVVAGACLLSGFFVVTARNVVRAAIFLMATLFCVAICYVMLSSEFLAVVQVLVYIGGVVVMILFTVMFTRKAGDESYVNPSKGIPTLVGAAAIAGALFLLLHRGLGNLPLKLREDVATAETLRRVGDALLTQYVIPFEIVSILLLMSLVGAVILIAKELKEEDAAE